jgi:hypothetical protein
MYSAGHEFGVSGERARQILSEVAKRLYGSRPFTPVLDRTISFLGQYIPGRAEEIEGKLFSEGLSAVPFRLEGLIRAAELLGRTPPFSVIPTKSLRLVYRRPGPVIKNIVRAGQRTIGHRGAATIGDVLVRLRDADQEGGPEFVEDVLSGEEDFHWLDRTGLWFWLSSVARNPMVRRIRKILSVANPVHIAALQAGIARDYRMRGYQVPRGVLLELCRQIAGLRVDADVVRVAGELCIRHKLRRMFWSTNRKSCTVANSRRNGRKSRLPARSKWQRGHFGWREAPANGIRHRCDVHQMLNSGDEEMSENGSVHRARAFKSLTAALP